MIHVILPDQGPLINLNDDVISDIVRRIFNTTDFAKEFESRKRGRFIKVIDDQSGKIHYVCLSNPDNDSRNAHLMQFISPAYVQYWNDPSPDKEFDIYIIGPGRNDRVPYIKMFYRCFITLSIKILNLQELGLGGLSGFRDYKELKACRDETSARNSHNQQTYFVDENENGRNQISIYGKTFGANAMESFILALTLRRICDKPVVFYPVIDNTSHALSSEQQIIMEELGIRIGETLEVLPSGMAKPLPGDHRVTSRDTVVFHYNLLQKYGEKRCYICGCDLEHLVIGSHIERVADIDHNPDYDSPEKRKRATDGDNGLWLCANHDKMFEYGIIYFDSNSLQINPTIQDQSDQDYIHYSLQAIGTIYPADTLAIGDMNAGSFHIKPEHYNNSMHAYLEKHKQRILSR